MAFDRRRMVLTVLLLLLLLLNVYVYKHISGTRALFNYGQDFIAERVSTSIPPPSPSALPANNQLENCYFIDFTSTANTMDHYSSATIIVGVSNHIGYSLAIDLHRHGTDVAAIEYYVNLELDTTQQRWYYLDMLRKEKLAVTFAMNNNDIDRVIESYESKEVTVVFVLSTSFVNVYNHDIYGVPNYVELLIRYGHLIESVSKSTAMRFVLVVDKHLNTGAFSKELLETFSVILLSYTSVYNLDTRIIKIDSSTSKCTKLSDFKHLIFNPPETNHICLCLNAICNDGSPSNATNTTTNIVFSTYFTHNEQFMRPYRQNSFQFLKGFLLTAKRHRLKIVIFHDEMKSSFINDLTDFYHNIEFIKYNGNYHHRSINDARFYIMYEYLVDHPEINSIILQDLRDGIFLQDPFKVMEVAGDYFYAGMDISFKEKTRRTFERCENKLNVVMGKGLPRLYPMLNAGTFGGRRHFVLSFLAYTVYYFEHIFPINHNCNMDAIDFITHRHFYDTMFSGYPFQGYMQIGLASPPGIAVRHKRTKYDL